MLSEKETLKAEDLNIPQMKRVAGEDLESRDAGTVLPSREDLVLARIFSESLCSSFAYVAGWTVERGAE